MNLRRFISTKRIICLHYLISVVCSPQRLQASLKKETALQYFPDFWGWSSLWSGKRKNSPKFRLTPFLGGVPLQMQYTTRIVKKLRSEWKICWLKLVINTECLTLQCRYAREEIKKLAALLDDQIRRDQFNFGACRTATCSDAFVI